MEKSGRWLVAEEFVEGVSHLVGLIVFTLFAVPIALREVEVLAKVGSVFFDHRFGSALAALIGDSGIVKGAVEAYAKVFVATVATFTASRLAIECPLLSAFVTVQRHGVFIFQPFGQAQVIRQPFGQAHG